jgi:zinc transport system ATP-binding protein
MRLNMALLKVQNLSLGYDSHAIVENLNFTVNTGDYLCIVGENGSGKSTLMKTLLHLQEPISGQILTGDGLKKNEIGYLPQQTIVQKDFPASVREIVLSGCQGRSRLRPFYSKEDKKLARINMERMEILDLEKRCYRELSGGQQQRVLLARALCATRKVLLLDEPVSGLDPKVTAQMYELIQKLNKDGITIIMISHDIAAAVSYASHILHIGDDIFFGTRDEYKKSEVGKLFLMQNKIALDNAGRSDSNAESQNMKVQGGLA